MAYFSNSADGDYLQRQCESCPIGEEACPVFVVQSLYNYDQLKKGNELLKSALTMLVDDKGDCQVKPLLGEKEDGPQDPLAWLDKE